MSLGRNILWNLGSFLWLTLLLILVTPYMVRQLGLDAYGVWAVLTAFTGYLSALDLGLGNALIRFLAAEHERGDRRTAEAFLRSGLTLQILLGGVAGAILLMIAPVLAGRWLHLPTSLVGEAVTSFRLAAAAVFLGYLVVAYAAIPAALRRFDLLAVRTVLLMTVQYMLFVLVLRFGGGLREVVVAFVCGTAAILIYLIAVGRNLMPGLVLTPGWDASAVRELFRFGRFKFWAQLTVTLLREFDRIAIAFLLPVGRLGFYAVPQRLSLRTPQIVEQIASPFYPAMTSQLAGGRQEELRSQYRAGSRLVAAVAFGILAVLGGLAAPILAVWLGPDFAREGTWVLRVLLLAYTASALFTLPSVAADGAGRPGIPATFLAMGCLVHMPLVVLGIHLWGLTGAALGVLVGFGVAGIGVGIIHARVSQLPPLLGVMKEMRGAFIAGSLTAVAALLTARTGFPGSGVGPLVVTLFATGLVYLLLLIPFRGLRVDDVRRLAAGLQRA